MNIDESERQTLIDMVTDVSGPDVKRVAILLMDQVEEVTDEIISEQLGVKLDEVRKALYKLHDQGIANYRRIRDTNTGWFIYYWKLLPDKITEVVITRFREMHFKLLERLQYERENMFFKCTNDECEDRWTFQQAMEFNFECQSCGGNLVDQDNSQKIFVLEKSIENVENAIEEQLRLAELRKKNKNSK